MLQLIWLNCARSSSDGSGQLEDLVEKKFGGSLPAFVAAFTKHQAISESDLDEMQRMIDRIRRGESK